VNPRVIPKTYGKKIDALFLREKEKNLSQISLHVGTFIVIKNFLQSQTFSYKPPLLIPTYRVM
jgi:hypothetical protein